jgi:hypothetical protein
MTSSTAITGAVRQMTAATAPAPAATATLALSTAVDVMLFWDYDTQWGADRSRCAGARPATWGALEFPHTDELLDLHARFGIPACFAIVGAAALPGERPYHDPAQIRRVHAAGHEIASHAFRHEWLPALDRDALRRTLRDSKDALEQCIGAPVRSFVPPFNQPFDYARGWSFSLAERREAGARRTTLRVLCETLRETGYQFCRVAYSPLSERLRAWLARSSSSPSSSLPSSSSPSSTAFQPGPPEQIAGVTCVRVGPCGFDLDRVIALRERAALREQAAARAGSVWRRSSPIALALYGHPHSLHGDDASQSATALRQTLAALARWNEQGAARCLTPRDLPWPS